MKYLLKALLLPLLALAVAAMWGSVHVSEPWSGLLVNLAASFLGSVITVFYIDALISRHERAQWTAVKARVEKHVERVANVCVMAIRTALRVGPEAAYFGPDVAFHSKEFRDNAAHLAENVLAPMLPMMRDMNEEAWSTLAQNLQAASKCADHAFGLFGPHIGARVTDEVLQLQETADGIVVMYFTFPDIYGVPSDRVTPRTDGSSSLPTQNALYHSAIQQLTKLLSECANVYRSLDAST